MSISAEMVFRALSDRTRLRILNMLSAGEACVCDLVAVLKVSQPKVSRHLSYLRKAGLVKARKIGTWAHYEISPAEDKFRSSILECVRACAQEQPQLRRDLLSLSKAVRSRRCN